jgi:class 3 adenylate cyclase
VCAAHGAENPDGALFCNRCAASVAVAEVAEHRKTVTVLFCDMTVSTALGERLDPAPLRLLLNRYFARMTGIVEVHGGRSTRSSAMRSWPCSGCRLQAR